LKSSERRKPVATPVTIRWHGLSTTWSITLHFTLALLGVAAVRDSKPVVAHKILELKAETAKQDLITIRKAAMLGNPLALFAAKLRGLLDGAKLARELLDGKVDIPAGYAMQIDEITRGRLDQINVWSGLYLPGASLSIAQVRQAMASVDPDLPLISIRPLEEQVAGQFRQQRLIARLTSFFGVLSLVLASIGLYGVAAYNAWRRVSEIGVRMALGANRGQVVRLILRDAFRLIVIGLLIGLPVTFAAGRFLGNQLYSINPYNPMVRLAAVLALGLSTLIASFVPAFRASLTSPLEALRAE
jgi:hypothetical protein